MILANQKLERKRLLSQRLAVDFVKPDAAHLRARCHKIDIVNAAVIAAHIDAHRSAVGAAFLLPPNVKRRHRDIFPV